MILTVFCLQNIFWQNEIKTVWLSKYFWLNSEASCSVSSSSFRKTKRFNVSLNKTAHILILCPFWKFQTDKLSAGEIFFFLFFFSLSFFFLYKNRKCKISSFLFVLVSQRIQTTNHLQMMIKQRNYLNVFFTFWEFLFFCLHIELHDISPSQDRKQDNWRTNFLFLCRNYSG